MPVLLKNRAVTERLLFMEMVQVVLAQSPPQPPKKAPCPAMGDRVTVVPGAKSAVQVPEVWVPNISHEIPAGEEVTVPPATLLASARTVRR
jgi:hypothetical protein